MQNRNSRVENGTSASLVQNGMLGAVRFYSYEAQKVNACFQKLFGVPFEKFWLGWVPGFDNQLLIDLEKFDFYLENNYSDYNNISMSDFVLTKFGKSAHNFLKKLI